MTEGQIILIDKPYRWSSFDVVKYVRKALRGEKLGHASTLDPFATGLLVLCSGKLTKKITEIQDTEKEYTGTFTLGGITASYDLETEVVERRDFNLITEEQIKELAKQFTGEIIQTPPIHSAAKVNGQRAYALARRGIDVELKSKTVMIHEFKITKIELPEVSFRVVCSKGTYIRSLANDFGKALGCGAYLRALCRTRIGSFLLKDAVDPIDFRMYIPEIKAIKE